MLRAKTAGTENILCLYTFLFDRDGTAGRHVLKIDMYTAEPKLNEFEIWISIGMREWVLYVL